MFALVPVQRKLEAPLLALRNHGGAMAIMTIANVTFYGYDQAGNAVSVTGSISVNFADWADRVAASRAPAGTRHMARAFRTLALLISAVALAAGCSVKDAPAPSLTGPSELSLSLTMAATPDTITQDGSSQALVVVVARDVSGRAVANLPIRFDVMKDGQVVDYGALSTKTGLTGATAAPRSSTRLRRRR